MRIEPDMPCLIVHPSMWGRLVKTLYRTPQTDHVLPDGFKAGPGGLDSWVCEFLSAEPVRVPIVPFGSRLARYASIPARWLKPLPPPEAEREESCNIGEGHEVLTDYAHG